MLVYRFQIPDPKRPVTGGPAWRPSGELIDFLPEPLATADVLGRTIDDVSLNFGTYGMGGAGFFALQLGSQWLVVALRGAGAWMSAEGRLIEDIFWRDRHRQRPWVDDDHAGALSARITGRIIAHLLIKRDAMRLELSDGFALGIESDPALRPAFEGDGAQRRFGSDDDLCRAVFLSPSPELWI